MTPAPQNAREQLAEIRKRDGVKLWGTSTISQLDRRFLLGLVDELAAAGSNVLDWADAALCRWCGARAGSLASVHDDGCPVGALRALLDTLR